MSTSIRSNPDLMVIGDSLAQGCRSLSVSDELCSQSYARIIARSQNWDFAYPRFPRPVLFDLEQEVRNLSLIGIVGALRRLRNNLDGWVQEFTRQDAQNQPTTFDNLAIAGVSIAELRNFTAGNRRERLNDELFPKMIGKPALDLLPWVPDAHIAINTAFVLNPSGAADLAGLTQLDWVERRKPRRLIAHFGHNDGLYRIGSLADATQFDALYDETLAAYKAFLDQLADLPREIKQIVVVLHPKIGGVANLDPYGARDASGYAQRYRTRFPLPGNEIRGSELRRIDERIKAFNRAIRLHVDALPNSGRFHFVDTYQIFQKYDFKNTLDASRQVVIDGKRIDNRYLEGSRRFVGRPNQPNRRIKYEFALGGLQSLDGMHLSAVGYAVLACEIMRKLDLVFNEAAILTQALRDEDLISRYNRNIHNLGYYLDTIEDLRPSAADEQELRFSTVIGTQQRVFQRTTEDAGAW